MEAWREELHHHGIEGQKWGVRNGPPYPLDTSQMSRRERKLVSKASKDVIRKSNKSSEDLDEFLKSPEYSQLLNMRYSELVSKSDVKRERHKRIAQHAVRNALITIGALAATTAYTIHVGKEMQWI